MSYVLFIKRFSKYFEGYHGERFSMLKAHMVLKNNTFDVLIFAKLVNF